MDAQSSMAPYNVRRCAYRGTHIIDQKLQPTAHQEEGRQLRWPPWSPQTLFHFVKKMVSLDFPPWELARPDVKPLTSSTKEEQAGLEEEKARGVTAACLQVGATK
jgi:hypothetical protein